MKRKLKRKVIWLDEWNIREQEAWFSDMALEGWKLIKLGAVFATFEEAEPQEIAYRCDVFNLDGHFDQQSIKIYREAGWEFVDSRKHVQVYRENKAGEASEVYTTQLERAETLSLLEKNIGNKGLLMFALTVFIILINLATLRMNPVQNYLADGFIIPVFTMISYLFIVIHMFTGMVHMRNLIKLLKSGEINGDYVNYHKKVNIKKLFSLCGVIFVGSMLIFTVAIIKSDHENRYDKISQSDLPVVQLSDIMDRVEYEQVSLRTDNYYKTSSSILVPKQYELRQSALVDNSEGDREEIVSYSYEVRNEWLAQRFFQEIKKRYLGDELTHDQISHDKFDEVWIKKVNMNLGLIVRSGKEVYYVTYYGADSYDEKMLKILSKIEGKL